MKQREIKFRVFDTEENKYFEPIYEAYKGKLLDLSIGLGGDLIRRSLEFPAEHESLFPDRYILEQFTGLKDKNGNDIYEGDIVKYALGSEPEDKGFVCKFKDFRWKFNNFNFPDDDFYGTVNYNYIQENCEVIGNIHQNKNLIK